MVLVRKRRVAPVKACDKLGSALRGVLEVFAAHGKRRAKRHELPRRGLSAQLTVGGVVFIEQEVTARIVHAAFFACLRRRCAA